MVAVRLYRAARMGKTAPGAILHSHTGDAHSGSGLGKTPGAPVHEGLGTLLAGQSQLDGAKHLLIVSFQRHGRPPEHKAGVIAAFCLGRPQAPAQHKPHALRTGGTQAGNSGQNFRRQILRHGGIFYQLAEAARKLGKMFGGKAPGSLYAPVDLALQFAALEKMLAAHGSDHKASGNQIGQAAAHIFEPQGHRVNQRGLPLTAESLHIRFIRPQWQHKRPQKTGFRFVNVVGHHVLQFGKACVQGFARGRVEPLQLLDALKRLCGHAGTQGAHPVKPKGMVTAQGVLESGHGFLKGIPCREKKLEGMMPQGKEAFGIAV